MQGTSLSKAFLFLAYTTLGSTAVIAFAHLSPSSSSCTAPHSATSTNLSPDLVRERIRSGRVYVHHDFLTESQLKLLQRDMHNLDQKGKFIVNGLSDVRKGLKGEKEDTSTTSRSHQGFDVKYDRSVCPIPWWQDSLLLNVDDSTDGNDECMHGDGGEVETLHSIHVKLQRLRRELAEILDRPTMMDSSLGHECYYSKSNPGSSLARHMDERHEEAKGPRGWLLPSRRSLSWLIYLSETHRGNTDRESRRSNEEWDAIQNGGMLRTFPQRHYRPNKTTGWEETVECGSHNGNLQVGWLLATADDSYTNSPITHPIFMDCWYHHINPYTGEPEPHGILYIVRQPVNRSNNNERKQKQIEYITVPWLPHAIQGNIMEFLHHRALLESNPNHSSERLFLTTQQQQYAAQFRLLEDREGWDRGDIPDGSEVSDILPLRGTLVVFDSVALPHEVTTVFEGFRSALAGWFHEKTQALGG